MEIEQFEKDFAKLKKDNELKLSIINVDDIINPDDTKIIINGEEIKEKVLCIICVEEDN